MVRPDGTSPSTTPTSPEQQAPATEPLFGSEQAAAGESTLVALNGNPGGYIDNAIPQTMFRLRFDAGFDINRPDRAEFFYGEWKELSFHPHGVQGGGVFFDPKARGPEQLPGRLDYQEVSSYFEAAYKNRLSAFLEVPVRFVDFDNILEDPDTQRMPNGQPFPEPRGENQPPHTNFGGISDLIAGFKAALLADPNEYLTFQLRTYIPTGDAAKGLGTGHVSLEPGLLFYERWDRVQFQAQLRDWIPVDGGAEAGNVLIYGLGLGYDVYQHGRFRITPITEFVGWTVLSGFESIGTPINVVQQPGVVLPTTHGVEDSSGATIINAKIGVRTYFSNGSDFYVGYGQALTGDRWYREIVRVEYRIVF
jgi:hypothetical protein